MPDANRSIERRKRFIINVITWAIGIGLYYLFMAFGFNLILPFLVAFVLAAILQKPIRFLSKKTNISKRIVTAILLIIMFLLILGPVFIIVVKVVNEFKDFWDYLKIRISDMPKFIDEIKIWIADTLKFLPQSMEQSAVQSINMFLDKLAGSVTTEEVITTPFKFDFSSMISSLASSLKGAIWNTTKSIPAFFIGLVMSIIATCFLSFSYDEVIGFIMRQVPEKRREAFERGKSIAGSSLKKITKSYFIIFMITFCELTISLLFIKLIGVFDSKYIPIIAFLTSIVDILPVLGTGTVLIPWGIISLITGKTALGISLIVIYVVILIVRQIMEPKLISHELGLNPVIILMVMYISLQLFGFIGMMFTVILIAIIKILNDEDVIHLWKKKDPSEIVEAKKKKSLFKKGSKGVK